MNPSLQPENEGFGVLNGWYQQTFLNPGPDWAYYRLTVQTEAGEGIQTLALMPGRTVTRWVHYRLAARVEMPQDQKQQVTIKRAGTLQAPRAIWQCLQRLHRVHPFFKGLPLWRVGVSLRHLAVINRRSWLTQLLVSYEETHQHQPVLNRNALEKGQLLTVADVQAEQVATNGIHIVTLPAKGTSEGLQRVAQTVTGLADTDWLLFLNETDCLPVNFTESVSQWLQAYPEAAVVLLDEWVTRDAHIEPLLRAQWDRDALWASPCLGRGLLIRRSAFMALGGFEGASPNLTLDELLDSWALRWSFEAGAARQTMRLCHLPVLRNTPPEVSTEYLAERQQRLQSLMNEHHPGVSVILPEGSKQFRLQWPLPVKRPLVSLIMPTRNGLAVLKPSVEAVLAKTEYPNFELLIVDNNSDCEDTLAFLDSVEKEDHRVRVLRWPHRFNFSAINAFGVTQARGSVLCFINNDVEPLNGRWLTEMVTQAVRNDIGCVGAKLYYPNGRIQHAGIVLGVGGVAGHGHRFWPGDSAGYLNRLQVPQQYSAVTAACVVVRRSVYKRAGGFNARHLPINYNDVDFCLKVKAQGYRNLWTPYAELVHHESVSRGRGARGLKRQRALKEARYLRKCWPELLADDPAYHPSLSPFYEDFSLAPWAEEIQDQERTL